MFDILYSLKGDKYIARHLKTVGTEKAAWVIAKNIDKLPAGTIHVAITCEDGRTIFDSSKDGWRE